MQNPFLFLADFALVPSKYHVLVLPFDLTSLVRPRGNRCRNVKSAALGYFFSITHCRGCWCLRAKSITCVTLVSAIS